MNNNGSNPANNIRYALLGSAAFALIGASPLHAAEVTIGGYIKADFIYDFDQDLGDTLAASGVATGDVDSETTFRAHAKQSRFNITGKHEEYTAKLEVDLFSGDGNELVSNSRHVRLRHAYGQAGNLLIGQTWSTFMDKSFIAYPTTVDFGGPAGETFIRQTQIRYSPGNGFELALENPQTNISGEASRDTLPDIVARYDYNGDGVKWFVAGVFRQMEVAGGINDGESTSVVGLNAALQISLGSNDTISGNIVVNGGRYGYFGFANPEAVVENGDLEFVDQVGGQINYEHSWGGPMNAKTGIVFGTMAFDDDFAGSLGAGAAETISTVHVNYRWSPFKNVNYGVEISAASREDFSGADGDATRFQFGAQYVF